ncbi:MAG: hypothetical protein D6793_03935, partial [Thermoflexia bacterium]
MDTLKRSLEELFSDFVPPAPEAPPSAQKVPSPAPEGVPPVPPAEQPGEPSSPSYWRELALSGQKKPSGVPLVATRVQNIRAQLLGNALILLVVILWVAFLIGSAAARVNRALAQVGEETRRANAALLASRAAADLFTAIGQSTLVGSSEQFVSNVTAAREGLREAQQHLLESAASLPPTDPLWAELARLR